MVEFVLSVLLAAHLLCVNVASGGPLVAAWLDWHGTRGDQVAARAAASLAKASLLGLLAGALLGVLIGWLKWDSTYRAIWLGPLSYKLRWAIVEAVFSLVLMTAWWLVLPRQAGGGRWAMSVRCLIALLAATNLLYHFPLLFSVAAKLADAASAEGTIIGPAEFRHLMLQGETPALAIHVALASVAAAGMVVIALAWQRFGSSDDGNKLARWGARWAIVPTLAQLPVGLWTLSAVPPLTQSQLMGTSAIATILFLASILSALWLMNELAHLAFGEPTKPQMARSLAAMLLTVVLMTEAQQQARFSQHSSSHSSATR